MADNIFQNDPYGHNISQEERRRIRNKIYKRNSRKRLLAAAESFREPVPNGRKHITDNTLQPTNTDQLRARDVSPTRNQPLHAVSCSMDEAQLESTSEECTKMSDHSVLAGASKRKGHHSQRLQQAEDCSGPPLQTFTQQQSDTDTVRPVSTAQPGAPSHEQESCQPMLNTMTPAIIETCISDRIVNGTRGVRDGPLSGSENEEGSQTSCIPAMPQTPPRIPAPTQNLSASLAQQVFELVQASLVEDQVRAEVLEQDQVRAEVLEQELNRRRIGTMRIGRYAACMMMDIKHITEAIAGIEEHSAVLDALVVEISKAAQKRAEEKVELHTRVNHLDNILEAFQKLLLDIASPC
ncbi:hypothetical protein O988_02714 [Pseudogymnoascus sp. VKM F-3808]|nr:hypothetical protein O988_02714 [Pseudogymnoascus sp. VKM F-3808]